MPRATRKTISPAATLQDVVTKGWTFKETGNYDSDYRIGQSLARDCIIAMQRSRCHWLLLFCLEQHALAASRWAFGKPSPSKPRPVACASR